MNKAYKQCPDCGCDKFMVLHHHSKFKVCENCGEVIPTYLFYLTPYDPDTKKQCMNVDLVVGGN